MVNSRCRKGFGANLFAEGSPKVSFIVVVIIKEAVCNEKERTWGTAAIVTV